MLLSDKQIFAKNISLRLIGFPIILSYRLLIQWILVINLPDTTIIEVGLNVYYGQGLIVIDITIIGDFVTVKQKTNVVNARPSGGCPIIGNYLEIGANSVITEDISINPASSVMVKDVPSKVLFAGNPAKIVKHL